VHGRGVHLLVAQCSRSLDLVQQGLGVRREIDPHQRHAQHITERSEAGVVCSARCIPSWVGLAIRLDDISSLLEALPLGQLQGAIKDELHDGRAWAASLQVQRCCQGVGVDCEPTQKPSARAVSKSDKARAGPTKVSSFVMVSEA